MRRGDLDDDPLVQFRRWLDEAAAAVEFPETMTLATATSDGRPSARQVLMKGADERGVVFFTGYGSRKGRELDANPRAAILFHWAAPLGRQVRIEGRVERVSGEESDAYFATRAAASRLSAAASRQSEEIASRTELERRVEEARAGGADGERPEHWGGFRVLPDEFEFWQHGDDRLHDRFRYRRDAAGGWTIARLQP